MSCIYKKQGGVHLHNEQRERRSGNGVRLRMDFWHPATPETGPLFLFFFFFYLYLMYAYSRSEERTRTGLRD